MFAKFEKYELPNFGYVRLPEITITKEEKDRFNLPDSATNSDFLKAITKEGFKNRKLDKKSNIKEYLDRVEMELNLVEELSFTDYFLLVWRVIDVTDKFGTFIDYGRGSCVASLVFYCLGVTGVDPIEKNLLFSRFMSKVRAKKKVVDGITYIDGSLAPDVDLNVSTARDTVVKWLNNTYPGKIAKICTLSTLTGKMLIKDVFKTFNEDVKEEDVKKVSDLIEKHFGIVQDIEDTYKESPAFQKWADRNKEVYETALQLRELIRQKSSHASGYLVSFYPLDGFLPLELNKAKKEDDDDEGQEKEVTVGYEMNDVSNFALKLDLLGLITNQIIREVLDDIPEKLEDIELDQNPIVYNQFQHGELLPYGLYQISADCALRVVNDIKPKNIFELSDVNAIARPGALSFLKDYVLNNVDCPHKAFEKTLKPTRNLCLYQEQAIQMAVALGFTPEEGEIIRRVIGKKKTEEVKEWKEKIYKKAEQNGFSKEIADLFWKIVDDSSKYQFNASHSVATSYLSALTVYLKYKYPIKFYLACLKNIRKGKFVDHVSKIQKELKHFKLKFLPPDILKSQIDFSIENNNIRFGLGRIKGISNKTIEKLNKFKHEYSNKFEIFQGANEAGIDIRVLNALIKSGAIGGYSCTRSRIVLEAQTWNILTDKEKSKCLQLGPEYDFDLLKIIVLLNKEKKDEKGKPFIKDSRFETIRNKYLPFKQIYLTNKENEKLTNWFFEHEMLGFAHSTTITSIFKEKLEDSINTIEEVKNMDGEPCVRFCGKVIEVQKSNSKKGKAYMRVLVEDDTASMTCLVFGDKIEEHEDINGGVVKEGDIVVVRGRKKPDAVFADVIATQKGIVTKIGDTEEKRDL